MVNMVNFMLCTFSHKLKNVQLKVELVIMKLDENIHYGFVFYVLQFSCVVAVSPQIQ